MFEIAVKIVDLSGRVLKAVEQASFTSFSHAAASIRKDAIASIEKSREPSAVGSPPHTRRGLFRRAILFAADEYGAVIGTAASVAGESGAAHEYGGRYKDMYFSARPFMRPALERALPRIAGEWRDSVGGQYAATVGA